MLKTRSFLGTLALELLDLLVKRVLVSGDFHAQLVRLFLFALLFFEPTVKLALYLFESLRLQLSVKQQMAVLFQRTECIFTQFLILYGLLDRVVDLIGV